MSAPKNREERLAALRDPAKVAAREEAKKPVTVEKPTPTPKPKAKKKAKATKSVKK